MNISQPAPSLLDVSPEQTAASKAAMAPQSGAGNSLGKAQLLNGAAVFPDLLEQTTKQLESTNQRSTPAASATQVAQQGLASSLQPSNLVTSGNAPPATLQWVEEQLGTALSSTATGAADEAVIAKSGSMLPAVGKLLPTVLPDTQEGAASAEGRPLLSAQVTFPRRYPWALSSR